MELGCIIVDDELDACKILKGLINKYIPGIKVLDIAHNVDSAIDKIAEHKPDLIFLDIEMPNGNGFTLVERMKTIDFEIIFATAFDQYAIKAIKYAALDYLLKPYDLRELKQAISKVVEKKKSVYNQKRIEVLLENIGGTGSVEKIALPTQDGYIYVNIRNIVRAHADGNYSIIHLFNNVTHIVSKALGDIEELLPPNIFFRVHRSSIVNMNYVSRFVKTEGNQIIMDDNSVLDVSHRRKDEFLKMMKSK